MESRTNGRLLSNRLKIFDSDCIRPTFGLVNQSFLNKGLLSEEAAKGSGHLFSGSWLRSKTIKVIRYGKDLRLVVSSSTEVFVVLDRRGVKVWEKELIKAIMDLVPVVAIRVSGLGRQTGHYMQHENLLQRSVFQIYNWLDSRINAPYLENAVFPGELGSQLRIVDISTTGQLADCLGRASPGTRSQVVIDCAAVGVKDTLPYQFSECAVWELRFGDSGMFGRGWAGRQEVLLRAPVTGFKLIEYTGEGQGRVLDSCVIKTDETSIRKNLERLKIKACRSVPQTLKVLALRRKRGALYLDLSPFGSRRFPAVASVLGNIYLRLRDKLIEALWNEQWRLFYVDRDLDPYGEAKPVVGSNHADRDWADPFVVRRGKEYYVFFEEHVYSKGRGHIACIKYEKSQGRFSTAEVVLEAKYHMSYPYVFEFRGEYYLIPEASENQTVELYRAVEFPRRWVLEEVLLDGVRIVDASIVLYNGIWWLFASQTSDGETFDELHVYFSEKLVGGKWVAHKMNPVVSDVRRTRGAGRLYATEGGIVRPSQNGSVRYGYGMSLNYVSHISETEYDEREYLEANAGNHFRYIGFHTINCVDGLCVVDMLSRSPRAL